MSVCAGIGVHRKRSEVAVVDEDGEVLANRHVSNGVEPILRDQRPALWHPRCPRRPWAGVAGAG
jgi:hypothetical protein